MKTKTVVLSINASWNIFNFRLGLIRALQAAGHRVVAVAPPDGWSRRLEAAGIEYRPIAIDKQGLSPLRDLALLRRYRRLLLEIRPDVFLGYTANPNARGTRARP